MKPIHLVTILTLAFSLCLGCSRSPSSTAPLSLPPSHGTVFLLQYDPAEVQADTNALDNLKQAVDKRLSKLGISGYWETPTNNAVRLSTPITEQGQIDRVENSLARQGMLQFRLVKEDSTELIQKGQSAPGYELMKQTNIAAEPKTIIPYLVKTKPELTGKYVQKAWVTKNPVGLAEINFQLDAAGAALFQTITGNNVGRQLAIILDGRLYSAPRILDPIPGGRGMISGNFTPKEANELADALDCPLPFPVKVTVEKTY